MAIVCRICLEEVEANNLELLDYLKVKMLNFLKININTELSEDPIICQRCSYSLQDSFEHKTNYLANYKYLCKFKSGENSVINIEEVVVRYEINSDIKLEKEGVCFLCLKYYQIEDLTCTNDRQFIDVIPEIEFTIVSDPYLCKHCSECLQQIFNFRTSCLDSEDIITSYMSSIKTTNKVDLQVILEHINNSRDEYIDLMEIKTEEIDIKVESEENIGEGGEDFNPNSNYEIIERPVKKTIKSRKAGSSKYLTVYQCPYCPYNNPRKANANSHILIHIQNVKMFKCDICNFFTKWRSSFTTHQLLHKSSTEVINYKCEHCTYQTMHKKHLRRHMKRHIRKGERLKNTNHQCYNCSYETDLKTELEMHMQIHQREILRCPHCHFETYHKKRLESHVCLNTDENFNEDSNRLINSRLSQLIDSLKQRIKREPYEENRETILKNKSVIRKQEDFRFISEHYRKIVDVHDWYYECNYCEYKAKRNQHMKDHCKKHQKKDIVYEECKLCDYKTKYKRTLRNHMKQKH